MVHFIYAYPLWEIFRFCLRMYFFQNTLLSGSIWRDTICLWWRNCFVYTFRESFHFLGETILLDILMLWYVFAGIPSVIYCVCGESNCDIRGLWGIQLWYVVCRIQLSVGASNCDTCVGESSCDTCVGESILWGTHFGLDSLNGDTFVWYTYVWLWSDTLGGGYVMCGWIHICTGGHLFCGRLSFNMENSLLDSCMCGLHYRYTCVCIVGDTFCCWGIFIVADSFVHNFYMGIF